MEEKVSINIGNAETCNEKIKKKFVEITEEGKVKMKNYVSEIDKKSCCKKFGCFLLKFIVICILLQGMVFFAVYVKEMNYYYYDQYEILEESVSSLRWTMEDWKEKTAEDTRMTSAKLDQILQKLSLLERKAEEKKSNLEIENVQSWIPYWPLSEYNPLLDRFPNFLNNGESEENDANLELGDVKPLPMADDER